MARNLTTQANVVITMNGKQADNTMKALRTQAESLTKQIEQAKKAGDTVTASRLNSQLAEVNRSLKLIESNTTAVERVMRNLDKATPRQLRQVLKTLEKQLEGIERGSDAWNAHIGKIKAVRRELDSLTSSMREQESGWTRVNRWLNDTQTFLAGAAAAATGLVLAGKAAVNAYAEMEQEMANVRKFTGMSAEDVELLNERFKLMDTRSSREQLNQLAQEAGRLGKTATADILGFVRAADKINVALDDLGDGATLTLSKLTSIFGEEQRLGTERSLLAIGSVINELSQNCSASAPYLAEFASRMGGVAAQAGMTVQQVMALAAVLDTTNQGVEAASTAVSQVITRLFQDPAKYARVAGLEVRSFTELLRKDTNAAFLTLLDTLQKAGGMEALAPMFKDMGENGARAIAALSSLATHIDEVRAQQEAANVAFREATSIDKEFEVQNTTVLAGMEKAKKSLNEIAVELGQKLQPMMTYAMSSSTVFLKVLSAMVSFIGDNHKAIISLTAAIVAYNVTVKASAIATAGHSAAMTAGRVVAQLYNASILLLKSSFFMMTGQVGKASVAFKAFSAVLKANPLGLLVSVATAAISAIAMLGFKTDEYSKSLDEAMSSATSFAGETAHEIREIDRLFGALEGAKRGTKEYEAAKNSILSKYSVYLKGLVNERGEITNLKLAYERLTFAAQKAAQARGLNAAKESLNSGYYKEIDSLTEELRSVLEEMGMPERESSRIITSVSQSVTQGGGVPVSAYASIKAFEAGNSGFWRSLFGTRPSKIADKINERTRDFKLRTDKLDKMDTRYFEGVPDKEIDESIRHISESLGSSVVDRVDVEITAVSEKLKKGINSVAGEAFTGGNGISMKTQKINPFLPTGAAPGSLYTPPVQTGKGQQPMTLQPFPMVNGGKMAGVLTRSQAEAVLRELMFEKSQRGSGDFSPELSPENPLGSPQPIVDDESGKRADALAKAAAAKAKKEFREGLDMIKAQHTAADNEIVMEYAKGNVKYLDYLEARRKEERRYYDESAQYYRDKLAGIKDIDVEQDKDYQDLLAKREDADRKYVSKRLEYERKLIRSSSEIREKELEGSRDGSSLEGEIRFLDDRLSIRLEALRQEQDLYAKGSKEWEKYK